MAFKSKLLTTAAIPLIALTWMAPVSAAPMARPDAQVEAPSLVIKVQSDEEELLKQQKQERRERRKQRNQQEQGEAQDDGEQVQPRRKKHAEAQQEQQDQQQMQQSEDSEPVKPRRKKNAEMQQEQPVQNVPADDSEPVKPRKKKQQAQDEQQMQEQQMQQSEDNAEPVKPRRKKQQAQDEQQMQEQQMQQSEDNAEPAKPRKKKQQAQDEQQMQEQQQSGDEEQTKPRRKKNAEAQQEEQNSNSSIEEIQTKPKRQKNADAENQADRPKRDKQKEVIADDPAKTADTIELPVENGAAVLDSDKDADKRGANREERKREREEVKPARVPKSDRDAQAGFKEKNNVRIEPVLREKGERVTGFQGYDIDGGRRVGKDKNDFRVIINIDGRIVVRDDDRFRLGRHGETRYERLGDGRIREVVILPNGDRIVTIRNRWGEIIRRSRIDRGDREIVIFYSPYLERGRDRLYLRDAGADLPPMRLRVPLRDYIADVSSEPDRDYVEFLEQPPVEPVERVYSVDEVKYSARIRDKVRRIDLDTITFDTGSAEIDMGQAASLKRVGAAIKEILDRDPGETFLIEGHTDAVGSDDSNLVLSDERAESVANVLSDVFDIPAENLVTQGYGEQYLKVDSDGPERMNRRVTIRRITSLVRPVAANEE